LAGRLHYDNFKYLQAQRVALMNAKTLETKELAERLGVSFAMTKRYLAGQSPIPMDMFYMRACEDPFIASYFQAYLKEIGRAHV